jgi:hypothetical protein
MPERIPRPYSLLSPRASPQSERGVCPLDEQIPRLARNDKTVLRQHICDE